MDIKQIKELVKLVEKSNIHELDIEEKDLHVKITRQADASQMTAQVQHIPAAVQTPMRQPAAHSMETQAPAQPGSENSSTGNDTDHLVEIPSPMVGTFYRSPSPGADPFVNQGDTVNAGSVLCIIEAMKLMNEIEAEISGRIVKILVEDSDPVEYNQPLFLIEKS